MSLSTKTRPVLFPAITSATRSGSSPAAGQSAINIASRPMQVLNLLLLLLLSLAATRPAMAQCTTTIAPIRMVSGAAISTPDAEGRTFLRMADYGIGDSFTNYAGAIANADVGGPNGTSSQALYRRVNQDQAMEFHVAIPNSSYTVLLHFSEPTATAAGQRVFDVSIENTLVEDNFDVFVAAGGKSTALVKSYTTTVGDNDLYIRFRAETGDAVISAIEIIPIGPTTFTQSVSMNVTTTGCYYAAGSSKATVRAIVSWTNATQNNFITVALGGQTRKIYPGTLYNVYVSGAVGGSQNITSPQEIAFEIPADGTTGNVTATFSNNPGCTVSVPYTAPAACPPTDGSAC